MIDLKKCKVNWDKDMYIPKKVYDFESEPGSGSPQEIAEAFLKENTAVLKISSPLGDLKYEKTTRSLGAKTVLFQQYYEGTPIHSAWVAVHIDNADRAFMVKNDTIPIPQLSKKLAKQAPQFLADTKIDDIIKNKIAQLGTLDSEIQKENMIYPLKGTIRPAWKVKFSTSNPAGSWILFIDKTTGHILDERDALWKVNGKGFVFMPNPVVTLDRDDLTDFKDKDQDVFKKAYKTVQLKDIDPSGILKGPYVDTTPFKKGPVCPDYSFMFTREDDRFEAVNAYYHIDSFQRYIQALGFNSDKSILARPIRVHVHGLFEDNSYYDPSPSKKSITYGDGGVDDAEDAEIVLHEYGHALQDAIIPGYGQNTEGRAMGEGFSDYIAASFFYKYKKSPRRVLFGEWDAKGLKPPKQCCRRLDSTKHYPDDMEGEEHVDGEIWSACLWKVRKLLGCKKADTVILESHFYLSQYSDFKDGAEAIIMAEKTIYGGKRTRSLGKIFKECGIIQ